MATHEETPQAGAKFDFSAYPPDTLFFDRREGRDRRDDAAVGGTPPEAPPPVVVPMAAARPSRERRARKERRRRVDPTTFEKQYSDDEIEFMNAMQYFKVQSGKAFPSHGEVLRVALSLGYRRTISDLDEFSEDEDEAAVCEALAVT